MIPESAEIINPKPVGSWAPLLGTTSQIQLEGEAKNRNPPEVLFTQENAGNSGGCEIEEPSQKPSDCFLGSRHVKKSSGRPATRPWFKRRQVDGVKVSRSISPKERREIQASYEWAADFIDRPLNTYLVVMPEGIDDADPLERSRIFANERKHLREELRYRRVGLTGVWTLEACDAFGNGQHINILFHLPDDDDLWLEIEGYVGKRYGGPPTAHIQPARNQRIQAHDGKWHSAPDYILKGCSPQAVFKQNMRRKATGPILGKRAGYSKDLGTGVRLERYYRNR